MNNIAIIGFGNQAKAWALNLRDSEVDFSIGLRTNSNSTKLAESMGMDVFDFTKSAKAFTHFIILTPDETHKEIIKLILKQKNSASFIYAHGYSIVDTDILKLAKTSSHLLLAPKSIASELRFEYETKGKIPAAFSFEYNKDEQNEALLKELARNIGITCLKEASFKDETYADLFSEQTILCSAIPYLAKHSFDTLVEKGISKEVAFFECFHELKSISATFVKLGPENFFNLISPNALIGSETGSGQLFNAQYISKLDQIFDNIESHDFMREIDKTDIDQLREKILKFWNQSELQNTYNSLKDELY